MVKSIYDINQVRMNPVSITYRDTIIHIEVHIIDFLVLYTKLLKSKGHCDLAERMTFSGDLFRGSNDGNSVTLKLFDISERTAANLTMTIGEAQSLHRSFLNYIEMLLEQAGSVLENVSDRQLILLE
jgi:hypothetical protein